MSCRLICKKLDCTYDYPQPHEQVRWSSIAAIDWRDARTTNHSNMQEMKLKRYNCSASVVRHCRCLPIDVSAFPYLITPPIHLQHLARIRHPAESVYPFACWHDFRANTVTSNFISRVQPPINL